MRCPSCDIAIGQSETVSDVFLIHKPVGSKEVLTVLACPLFGRSSPKPVEPDILDTPSYWRTAAHFNHMWERSR